MGKGFLRMPKAVQGHPELGVSLEAISLLPPKGLQLSPRGSLTWYGFSPVWIRRWLLRVCRCRKRVPQISQGYGFSPVWMSTCARR